MATLETRVSALATAVGGDILDLRTVGGLIVNCYGLRTVGYGVNPVGFEIPFDCKLTRVVFYAETNSSGGTSTAELRKNGSTMAGTSATVAAAPTPVTGLSLDLVAGDLLTCYCSAIGTGTIGRGLYAQYRVLRSI